MINIPEIALSTLSYLSHSGLLLAVPSAISTLFSGITHFIPQQNDFQTNHEALTKGLLKKRSEAVIRFVASVEFPPESIMDVKDVQSEELVLTLDKYADYKYEVFHLKKDYYRNEAGIRNSFFASIVLAVVALLHPYLGVAAFFAGLGMILYIYLKVRALSVIRSRTHDLKTCADFLG